MQQPQISNKVIADAPFMECECGGITFTPLVMMKRVSKLLVPGSHSDIPIEIPAMKCDSCGKIPSFVHGPFQDFPEELKAKSNGEEDNIEDGEESAEEESA